MSPRGATRATIAAIGAAFAAGGPDGPRVAGRPLRPRPPPLGVHARRARRCAGGRAAAGRARRRGADRRDEPRRSRARPPRASIRTWAPWTSRRSSTSTRPPGAPRVRGARARRPHRRGAARAGVPLRRAVRRRARRRAGPAPSSAAAALPASPRGWQRARAASSRTSDRRGCTRAPAPRSSPPGPRSSRSTCSSRPPRPLEDARAIAALIRDGGRDGLPGVRAIGVALGGGVAQVSMNVERPFEVPLAAVVDAVRAHADVASAELVGLAPRRRVRGLPAGCADAGLRSRSPPDRERTRLLSHGADQAQTPDQAPRQRRRRRRVARAHRAQAHGRARRAATRERARAREGAQARQTRPARPRGAARSSRRCSPPSCSCWS